MRSQDFFTWQVPIHATFAVPVGNTNIVPAVVGKKIYVVGISHSHNGADTYVTLQDSLTGVPCYQAHGVIAPSFATDNAAYLCSVDNGLNANVTVGAAFINLVYYQF